MTQTPDIELIVRGHFCESIPVASKLLGEVETLLASADVTEVRRPTEKKFTRYRFG
jgi:hypothetical protein